MKLRIADNLSLPSETVTETLAILGIRGVGKSHTASILAEEMLKVGQPICVYDPTGAWHGLKSSADGKSPGFPVVIFGGEHADVPLAESAGEVVARVLMEKRIPAILDCSLLRKGARLRLMSDFCETLYHHNRQPLHFFIDEAHTLAPQRLFPEVTRVLGALEDILLQGRRGLGATIISQRPTLVNKNLLSMCSVLVAMRIVGPQDRKAIEEWIEVHADRAEAREVLSSLPGLKRGEGWVWSPGWLNILQRTHFRGRETFDSSATPVAGARTLKQTAIASVDLEALGQEIAATIERAKADDPKELRKRIADLEKALRTQPASTPKVETKIETVVERVEVPVLLEEHIVRCHELIGEFKMLRMQFDAKLPEMEAVGQRITEALARATRPVMGFPIAAQLTDSKPPSTATELPDGPPQRTLSPQNTSDAVRTPSDTAAMDGLGKGGLHKEILDTLAFFEGIGVPTPERKHVGAYLGKSPEGGYFVRVVGELKNTGLITYPDRGTLALTEEGRSKASPAANMSLDALHAMWIGKLGGLHSEILRECLNEYPNPLTREEVAERLGKASEGGYFVRVVGELKNRGFIKYPTKGQIAATDLLFPKGLS